MTLICLGRTGFLLHFSPYGYSCAMLSLTANILNYYSQLEFSQIRALCYFYAFNFRPLSAIGYSPNCPFFQGNNLISLKTNSFFLVKYLEVEFDTSDYTITPKSYLQWMLIWLPIICYLTSNITSSHPSGLLAVS